MLSSLASPPDASTPASGGSCEGLLDPASWIRLLVLCRMHSLSGRLEVTRGRGRRTLFLIGGEPVDFQSTLPEDSAAQTLEKSGVLSRDRIRWMKERLRAGEDLEESLERAGSLSAEDQDAHHRFRIQRGVQAPLELASATWRFVASPRLKATHVDPQLFLGIEPLGLLLEGVERGVNMDAELPQLAAPGRGCPRPSAHFETWFPAFGADAAFAGLGKALGETQSFDGLFRLLPGQMAALLRLMWVLESGGLVEREGETPDTTLEAQLLAAWEEAPPALPLAVSSPAAAPAPAPTPAPAPARASRRSSESSLQPTAASLRGDEEPTLRMRAPEHSLPGGRRRRAGGGPSRAAVVRMIEGDHAHRLGQDHYTFLGIPEDADSELVDQAFARLVKRWRLVERDEELPDDLRSKATELVAAAKTARRVLSNGARRAAYDQTLERSAPREAESSAGLGEAPGGAGTGAGLTADSLARARSLMADGSFHLALPLLKQARLDDPSSPEVLAGLGWATWKTQGDEAIDDAVDFLKLALTFDKRSVRALEYLGRIFLAQDDADRARPVLRRFLKHQPTAQWAKDALASLPEPGTETSEPAEKGRFWRKGGPG